MTQLIHPFCLRPLGLIYIHTPKEIHAEILFPFFFMKLPEKVSLSLIPGDNDEHFGQVDTAAFIEDSINFQI